MANEGFQKGRGQGSPAPEAHGLTNPAWYVATSLTRRCLSNHCPRNPGPFRLSPIYLTYLQGAAPREPGHADEAQAKEGDRRRLGNSRDSEHRPWPPCRERSSGPCRKTGAVIQGKENPAEAGSE